MTPAEHKRIAKIAELTATFLAEVRMVLHEVGLEAHSRKALEIAKMHRELADAWSEDTAVMRIEPPEE